MKKSVAVFGVGEGFRGVESQLKEKYTIKAYVDNDTEKQGNIIDGMPIYPAEILGEIDFDYVIITPIRFVDIAIQLHRMGVPDSKIKLPLDSISLRVSNESCVAVKDSVSIELTTASDALVYHETFISELYGGYYGENITVIDIGMNIGDSALFFAKNDWVRVVYAYEPFPVYSKAIENIERNAHIKNKIVPFNYGIVGSPIDASVDYSYDPEWSAGSNVFTQADKGVSIRLMNASDSLSGVVIEAKEKRSPILLKLDVEGCEYAIINDLYRTGLIKEIDVVLFELHFDPKCDKRQELFALLVTSGFKYKYNPNYVHEGGMLYAFR